MTPEREQQNPARTLSEVPLDVLNRFACDVFEPLAALPDPMESSYRWSLKAMWHSDPNLGEAALSWQPRDLTDGAGMKMLLERMLSSVDVDSITFRDVNDIEVDSSRRSFRRIVTTDSNMLGRAVLEAFCLSEGFQVEA